MIPRNSQLSFITAVTRCRLSITRKCTDSLRVRKKIGNAKISKFRPSTSLTRRSTTRSSGPPNHLASPPRERSRRSVDFFTGSDGRGSVPDALFLLLRLQGVECDFAELLLQFSNLLRMSAQPVEELFLVLNARANEICRGLRAAVE